MRNFQLCGRANFYNGTVRSAIAALALFTLSSGADAVNDNISISSIGAEGHAFGTSSDACGYTGIDLYIAASGIKNVNSNGNTSVVNSAFVQINRYDSCQGIFIQAIGEADNISLSFAGGVSSGQVPKGVTGSGQIPVQVTTYTATDVIYGADTLTFKVSLSQLGPVMQNSGMDQQIYQTGTSPSTKTTFTDHFDQSSSFASIASYSLFLASNSVKPLPALTQAQLINSKSHSISINH
jgi:hypothetical protein